MSIKSSIRNIKCIFQDAVIRIPYFVSAQKPTNTIAIVMENENQKTNRDQLYQINQIIKKQTGIVGSQEKIYYNKQTGFKTYVLLFQSVDFALNFYFKYAYNYDKILMVSTQFENNTSTKRQSAKHTLYFCKDITQNGINMEEILYNFGKVCVQVPESLFIRNLIKQVAKHVFVEGIRAEQQLIKCKSLILPSSSSNLLDFMNPKILSSEAVYYRWRVYSYLQGDGDKNYRMQPYQMTHDGPIYYPPDQNCQKYQYRVLNHHQRIFFTKLMQSLTSKKYHIEQAMSFCIINAGSAVQICCILSISIIQSCLKLQSQDQIKINKNAQIKHLISIFYLISDILFNSPSTIYRDIFTVLLPIIMQKIPRIAEVNTKIGQIVEIWNKKFLFEDQFLKGLNITIKDQLPSMQPLGMQQMTRSQHQCYKQLMKIQTPDQIQQMCWKYGISFSNQKIAQSLRNLAAVLAIDRRKGQDESQPQPGQYDGEPLNEKDIIKIKTKSCRVISCEDVPIKNLFEKQNKNSKSISYD